jgi:hypothetical protein
LLDLFSVIRTGDGFLLCSASDISRS